MTALHPARHPAPEPATQAAPPTQAEPPTRPLPLAVVTAASALLMAVLAGLAAGVATSYLQGELPGRWNVLADSGAVWTAFAFAIAALCAGPRWVAVGAGTLALFGEVAGYYGLAAELRGLPSTMSEQVLWTVAALWIGPLTGAAAHYWRRGSATQSLAAFAGLAGVVVGEGMQQLLRVGSRVVGWTEIWVGVALALGALISASASWRGRAVATGVGLVVTLAVYALYGQTVLM